MSAKEALDRTVRLVRDAVADEVSDELIISTLQSFRVRIITDDANVSTRSGQTVVTTLVSLIARMGIQIELDCPDAEIIGAQPPLRGTNLRTALIDFGSDLVPGTAVVAAPFGSCDATLIVGDTVSDPLANAWRLTGTGWEGRIGRTGGAQRWDADWPIGALTAATLASGEVFKMAIRQLPLRPVWDEFMAPCDFVSWDFAGNDINLAEKGVIPVDIISAGAIAQAALYVLFRLPIELNLRIFDDDQGELTNINRQLLMRRGDRGLKVQIVTSVAPSGFKCNPIGERFSLESSEKYGPLAPHVLVGTDDIPARWVAQHLAHGWLGVGATTHFETSTSSHVGDQACAGCLHPRDDDGPNVPIPTISFVSFWAGLALAVRFLHEVGGKPYPSEKQHLWLSALRMGDDHAALWRPIPARRDCPVQCRAAISANFVQNSDGKTPPGAPSVSEGQTERPLS